MDTRKHFCSIQLRASEPVAYRLVKKTTSNAQVTVVAAKENCFHEPFKTIKTVRISKFIRQRVSDCRAGIVERPTTVRAELTARHSVTVPVGRS